MNALCHSERSEESDKKFLVAVALKMTKNADMFCFLHKRLLIFNKIYVKIIYINKYLQSNQRK